MKRIFYSIALASTLFAGSAFAGPSAKFAATYTKGIGLGSVAYVSGNTDAADFDLDAGYTLATIKVPQDKELLVGVSANVGIVTDTSIKGKNGGAARAIAGGGAGVIVFAVPHDGGAPVALGEPGFVILNGRVQVLDATLGGVIESCEDTTGGTDINGNNPGDEGYIDTPDGKIDIATECLVTDEEIGLALGTMSANHFNFVLPNMDQGEYDIVAFFVTGALAAIDINETSVSEGGTVEASAFGLAFIGKTMVTVQQVRAAKGGIIESDIEDL